MLKYSIFFVLLLSGVFLTSARPQYQCTVPCPATYPVSPNYPGCSPTLNILVRTEPCPAPPKCPPPPCPPPPCPPPPCPPPSSRRFCSSVCSMPGAIMDTILSGEVAI